MCCPPKPEHGHWEEERAKHCKRQAIFWHEGYAQGRDQRPAQGEQKSVRTTELEFRLQTEDGPRQEAEVANGYACNDTLGRVSEIDGGSASSTSLPGMRARSDQG